MGGSLITPFDFNIEHIPGAKMGLVDYISLQPNQKAKVTNKYDEEFVVATITRIRDAITAIYINTTPENCQSHHIISVNQTDSTRASIAQQTNHSILFFALNLRTNQLLLALSANAAQSQPFNNSFMNTSNASPQTPPTPATSKVTFQSTPKSAVNSNRSSNEGTMSSNLEFSKEEDFENNLTQLFRKGFLAVLISKDAVLKEVRECILQGDEQRCKEVNPYLHSYCRDLHVCSRCVCVDKRVAIPHSIQDAVLESLHLTHPGSLSMITLGQYAFWPICTDKSSIRPHSANHALRVVRILNQSFQRRNGSL